MSYEYYCTSCGKRLHQTSTAKDAKITLFDLQPILDEQKPFNILKWRMTEAELTELAKREQPVDGFYPVKLTLRDLLVCMANEHNLNAPVVAEMTLEDINDYVGEQELVAAQKAERSEADELLGFEEVDDDAPAFDSIDEEEEKKKEKCPAIRFLESMDTAVDDILFTQEKVRADLGVIFNVFRNHEFLTFDIKLLYEKDTEGGDVLSGYHYRRNGVVTVTGRPIRVCPCCDRPIFLHAGTAKHQSVAFIGYQSSGKTSTILALADYAQRAIGGTLTQTGVWGESSPIPEVEDCDILDLDARVAQDLALFRTGIAPQKTEAFKRLDAYSITLRFKNRLDHKSHIVTLVDLPGELCFEAGEENPVTKEKYPVTGILTDRVLKQFQVALSCDAYIVCFDTSRVRMDENAMTMIRNNCIWANCFQELRLHQPETKPYYLPMMVLFTKCAELEENMAPVPKPQGFVQPVKQTYMFYSERLQMGLDLPENQRTGFSLVYAMAMNRFNEVGDLKRAYHSLLRSSPFGYSAPHIPALNNMGYKIERNPNGTDPAFIAIKDSKIVENPPYHAPTPKQIDKLMRWVLSVCGAIPTDAAYTAVAGGSAWKLMNYCLPRQQFRQENPHSTDNDQEALARCALFSNPGEFDVALVESHHSKLQRFPVTVKMKLRSQGNN